ncbi:related to Acetoacetyl-CoA synthetase [Phialocephala subalpina]|uniref:Related to Acetoacetyl-CoA synthetase n=1 Tax=Phialocephala subalpina TaxID=576137 RepID=A0A1L7WI76_9HELO|nr:related to Acetoacetyl-CoA synthetase [Phialocephala subalpina]
MEDYTGAPLWKPSHDDLTKSSLARFRNMVSEKTGRTFTTYDDLHEWSVNPETAGDFWMMLFEFLNMDASVPPAKAFEPVSIPIRVGNCDIPKFFPSARLNFARSVLSHRNSTATALIESREGSLETNKVAWGELYSRVQQRADALKSLGIGEGDRVAAVIANTEHSISLCLATLSLGGIWSSISPDFGTKGILDRLLQIRPKVVFADSSTVYNGKRHDLLPTVRDWAKVLAEDDSLVNIIFTPSDWLVDISSIQKTIDHGTFLSLGIGRPLEFLELPFSQPAFIFYSSGTTGSPKCILHSAGGVLLQVRKDYELHIGLLPSDILFQYTTTAWIMWAFIISALGTGSTIILYSGSPVYPNINFLPKLISKLKVTVLGTSAKYLTELKDSGSRPRCDVDLSPLRKVSSTGSVLPMDVAVWFYEHGFPKNVQLISGSGGTDCSCAFVCGNPFLPLHADEIQCKALGMAIDVFNSDGEIIRSGEPGELVCKQPFPSQPITFWGEGGEEAYKNSYFSMFGATVWVQGDLIRIGQRTRGVQMLGRSDGVLNPAGVRFGSAEIYNVVRNFIGIEDSVCVGQRRPQDRDESVLLFVKLKDDVKKTTAFKDQLKEEIGKKLTRRHIPKHVFYVDAIPHSVVGKKLEILVKNVVNGRKVKSSVVVNPESLMIYERFFDLEKAVKDEDRAAPKL